MIRRCEQIGDKLEQLIYLTATLLIKSPMIEATQFSTRISVFILNATSSSLVPIGKKRKSHANVLKYLAFYIVTSIELSQA